MLTFTMQGPAGQPGSGGQRGPNVSNAMSARHVLSAHKAVTSLIIKYHQYTTTCGGDSHHQNCSLFISPNIYLPPPDYLCICVPIGSPRGKRSEGANWKAWRKGEISDINKEKCTYSYTYKDTHLDVS